MSSIQLEMIPSTLHLKTKIASCDKVSLEISIASHSVCAIQPPNERQTIFTTEQNLRRHCELLLQHLQGWSRRPIKIQKGVDQLDLKEHDEDEVKGRPRALGWVVVVVTRAQGPVQGSMPPVFPMPLQSLCVCRKLGDGAC